MFTHTYSDIESNKKSFISTLLKLLKPTLGNDNSCGSMQELQFHSKTVQREFTHIAYAPLYLVVDQTSTYVSGCHFFKVYTQKIFYVKKSFFFFFLIQSLICP